MNKDFRKFATGTKINGKYMSGMTLDDYSRSFNNRQIKTVDYITPYVVEQSQNYGVSIDIFSRLIRDRIIFIGDEIDDYLSNVVTAQLLFLSNEDPEKKISVYLNTPGGSVISGLSIYDTAMMIESPISTVVTGLAASMGSIMMCMGDPGERYMLPHSSALIHQPLGGASGQCADIEIACENIKQSRDVLYKILSEHTGQSIEQIAKDADRDHWFTAHEAVEYGLADTVLEPKKHRQ